MTTILQGRADVARLAHNQEVVGSIPTPATNLPACPAGCKTPRRAGGQSPGADTLTEIAGCLFLAVALYFFTIVFFAN
jgi:hypothetical protein